MLYDSSDNRRFAVFAVRMHQPTDYGGCFAACHAACTAEPIYDGLSLQAAEVAGANGLTTEANTRGAPALVEN